MIARHSEPSAHPADHLARLQLRQLDHHRHTHGPGLEGDFDPSADAPGIAVEAPGVFAEWEPLGPERQIGEALPAGVRGGFYVDRMMHNRWHRRRTLPHPQGDDYTRRLDVG